MPAEIPHPAAGEGRTPGSDVAPRPADEMIQRLRTDLVRAWADVRAPDAGGAAGAADAAREALRQASQRLAVACGSAETGRLPGDEVGPGLAPEALPGESAATSVPPPGPRWRRWLERVRAGQRGAPAETGRGLRVLYVLYGDFTSNSALHLAGLTAHLPAAGYECVVAVERGGESVQSLAAPVFRAVQFAEVPAEATVFRAGRGPDVVHVWTPRERGRRFCAGLRLPPAARLLVHLEDNEDALTAAGLGVAPEALAALTEEELARRLPEDCAHPRRWREFVRTAAGVTVVVESLRRFVPAGLPVHVVPPAADERFFFPRSRNDALRRALRIDDRTTVVAYHGNVHAANADEVGALYEAVARLNAQGESVLLLRLGRNAVDVPAGRTDAHVLEIGRLPRAPQLPEILAAADLFVQPGAPGGFNDYRLPSKLPEFFALGRPVILPRTNLGLVARDGRDALVLPVADAPAIADAIRRVRADPALATRLAEGARRFATAQFSWARSARGLDQFYRECLRRELPG